MYERDKMRPYGYVVSCCCLAMSLTITCWLGLQYMELYNRSVAFEEIDDQNYDKCGGVALKDGGINTRWSMLYRFNAILYFIYTSLIGASALCICIPPCLVCPACCLVCASLPTMVAIALTATWRFNEAGALCATNETIYTLDNSTDMTFAEDAARLKTVFIAQAALHVPFGVCGAIGFIISFAVSNF